METEITTIFSSICAFLLAHKADIATKVIASATYDGLKKVINLSSLKDRIKKFFSKDDEAEKFLEIICTKEIIGNVPPIEAVNENYKALTGNQAETGLYNEIEKWIQENEGQIITIGKMDFKNKGGFNIGIQNASKDIYNIQGDYIAPKNEEK